MLIENGVLVSVVNILLQVFFFTSVVQLTELGYFISLTPEDFMTELDYLDFQKYVSDNITMLNILNNMVITMATIGFGDFYVRDLLSRAFILLVSLMASIIFPLYVVAFTNYLKTNYEEEVGMVLLQSLELRGELRHEAAIVIQKWFISVKAKIQFEKRLKVNDEKNYYWKRFFRSIKELQLHIH